MTGKTNGNEIPANRNDQTCKVQSWKGEMVKRALKDFGDETEENLGKIKCPIEYSFKPRWACRICNKDTFTRRFTRDRHEMTHNSADKYYECPICGRTLKRPDNLLIHISRRHSEKRLFKCQFCPKTLKGQAAISNHELTKHMDLCFSNPRRK